MTVRIALAGTGYIADIHARALLNQANAQLSAVVTTRADGAAAFREKYHIPQAYPSLDTLIQEDRADALVVCTPNALHATQTIQALLSGMHVMVEKPMAMNAGEAAQMHRTSQETGCLLMVAHCWRFDKEVRWLKEQAGSGRLGQIIRTKGYGVHANWGPSGWFIDRALAGGGAMADMGIHAIDTARYLLGDPQPVSVYARMGTHYIESEVDDTGVLLVNWGNGTTSYIESGWWQPHRDGSEASTQLYGRLGFGSVFPTRLELPNPEAGKVEIDDPDFAFPRPEQCEAEMYEQQMAYFLDCIRSGKNPVPGGREGWTNMRVSDAAYESSRTGEVVKIQGGIE